MAGTTYYWRIPGVPSVSLQSRRYIVMKRHCLFAFRNAFDESHRGGLRRSVSLTRDGLRLIDSYIDLANREAPYHMDIAATCRNSSATISGDLPRGGVVLSLP